MGYYTYYSLNTDASEDKQREIALWMVDNLNYFDHKDRERIKKSYSPLELVVGSDSMKWYKHQDDMQKIARAFPDVKFELYGEGEDREDTWIEYYWNDKFESITARLIFDAPPSWAAEFS